MEQLLDTFAPAKYSADEMLETEFHKEMLAIAFPKRSGSDRWFRLKNLNKFRRLKIGFFIRQSNFLARLKNYLFYKKEFMKTEVVSYIPPSIQLETGKNCLLGCPGCSVGLANINEGLRFRDSFATLENLKSTIDQTHKKVFQVYLHLHGEPLLNKHLFDASLYARSKGLWTAIHTNLMPQIQDLSQKLIDAKFCNIVVSIDAATKPIYDLYRRMGDVDLVFDKIEDLAKLKQSKGLTFPWITAKFHVFEHNWHEIKAFKERALNAGADEVVYVAGFSNGIYTSGRAATEYEFNLDSLNWEPRIMPNKCPFLWSDMRFDVEGGIISCGNGNQVALSFSKHDPLKPLSVVERYNSEKHRKMRRFFLGKEDKNSESLPEPCKTCEIVREFKH